MGGSLGFAHVAKYIIMKDTLCPSQLSFHDIFPLTFTHILTFTLAFIFSSPRLPFFLPSFVQSFAPVALISNLIQSHPIHPQLPVWQSAHPHPCSHKSTLSSIAQLFVVVLVRGVFFFFLFHSFSILPFNIFNLLPSFNKSNPFTPSLNLFRFLSHLHLTYHIPQVPSDAPHPYPPQYSYTTMGLFAKPLLSAHYDNEDVQISAELCSNIAINIIGLAKVEWTIIPPFPSSSCHSISPSISFTHTHAHPRPHYKDATADQAILNIVRNGMHHWPILPPSPSITASSRPLIFHNLAEKTKGPTRSCFVNTFSLACCDRLCQPTLSLFLHCQGRRKGAQGKEGKKRLGKCLFVRVYVCV